MELCERVILKDYVISLESGKREKGGALNTGIPSIGAEHLDTFGGFKLSNLRYISSDFYHNMKSGIIKRDDILIVKDGATTGKVSFVDDTFPFSKSAVNEHIFILRVDERIHAKYLFHYLHSSFGKNAILGDFRGSTVGGISKGFINLRFPLPPLDVQRRIAETLDKVTELISLRKTQLEKLDELVKVRFVEMFEDKDFPKITIGELVASKVSSVKKVFLPTDTIKYIDISSIDNKRNVMMGYTEYILKEAPSRAQQHIRKDDIVVSTVRPNLKNVAITGYEYDNLVASSGFCVLRAEKCVPSYLMAVVCSDNFTDAMTKVVTGANYPAIKDSDVRGYVVPNPPVDLQEQFASFVSSVEEAKAPIQQSLDTLETLKKSLMQEYFG